MNKYPKFKGNEIIWKLKKATVIEVSKRKKIIPNEQGDEYAVIYVGCLDDYDDFVGTFPPDHLFHKNNPGKRFRKFLGLMCFEKSLYSLFIPGESYTFEGKEYFQYGAIYHVIKKAYDSLGFKVGSGSSYGENAAFLVPEEEEKQDGS